MQYQADPGNFVIYRFDCVFEYADRVCLSGFALFMGRWAKACAYSGVLSLVGK